MLVMKIDCNDVVIKERLVYGGLPSSQMWLLKTLQKWA